MREQTGLAEEVGEGHKGIEEDKTPRVSVVWKTGVWKTGRNQVCVAVHKISFSHANDETEIQEVWVIISA